MRLWIWFVVAMVIVVAAFLAVPPSETDRGLARGLRDSGWLPRNAFGSFVANHHAAGAGHVPGYHRLGSYQEARDDLVWLRVTEIYSPVHPGAFMDTRRALAYAYATIGRPEPAAARMLDAARLPNQVGFYGGIFTELDWERAVLMTYDAHGFEAALEVWREGLDALELNERLYLEQAIADGSALTVEEVVVANDEATGGWPRDLYPLEERYRDGTRIELVERLLTDGDVTRADTLLAELDEEGAQGWPLTSARIQRALNALESGGEAPDAGHLADLSYPLVLASSAEPMRWHTSVGYTALDLNRTVHLHDILGRCDDVRQIVDAYAASAEVSPPPSALQNSETAHRAWRALSDACWISSWRGDNEADELCRLRRQVWQQEADRIESGDQDQSWFPTTLGLPPETLECYAPSAP